jgi:hypothetical protein
VHVAVVLHQPVSAAVAAWHAASRSGSGSGSGSSRRASEPPESDPASAAAATRQLLHDLGFGPGPADAGTSTSTSSAPLILVSSSPGAAVQLLGSAAGLGGSGHAEVQRSLQLAIEQGRLLPLQAAVVDTGASIDAGWVADGAADGAWQPQQPVQQAGQSGAAAPQLPDLSQRAAELSAVLSGQARVQVRRGGGRLPGPSRGAVCCLLGPGRHAAPAHATVPCELSHHKRPFAACRTPQAVVAAYQALLQGPLAGSTQQRAVVVAADAGHAAALAAGFYTGGHPALVLHEHQSSEQQVRAGASTASPAKVPWAAWGRALLLLLPRWPLGPCRRPP